LVCWDGEGWADPREMMMTLMVVVKYVLYIVKLTLPYAFDLWFRAILDGITVNVYSVPIGPGIISLTQGFPTH
jgi:hypothetical protein